MTTAKKGLFYRATEDLRHPIRRWGYVFMIPGILYFLLFLAFPIFRTVWLSFTVWRGFGAPPQLVGFENYRMIIFDDAVFHTSLTNTWYYVVMVVPLSIIIPLILSLVFDNPFPMKNFFRTVYFLPSVTSMVAIAMMWSWAYEPLFGFFNGFLKAVGAKPLTFLKDPTQAMPSVAVMGIWARIGYNMIICRAGLTAIPNEYYQAARIDGANWLQRITRITLPLLMPTVTFLVVTGMIANLQVFTQIFVMTHGGPGGATRTLAYHLYEMGFGFSWFGRASAMAVILFLMIMIITVVQLKLLKPGGTQEETMSDLMKESGLIEKRLGSSEKYNTLQHRVLRFSVKTLLLIIVSIVALFMIAPFAWMIITSIKPKAEIFTLKIIWIPSRVSLESYIEVFKAAPFLRYMLNSLIISSTDVASSLVFSTMTGYAFAKFKVRGANLIFMIILSGLMIPFSVRLIPMYLFMVNLGLSDTYFGVIAPNLLSIMGIFLLRQYALSIPDELIDFARIDGASEPRIFFVIIMPLCKPALAALGIFKFMFTFNDFLWPLVMINDVLKRTITVGLAMFSGYYTTYYGQFMAASTFAVIPIFIVYLFFQRQIIQGIALTGLKG